MKSEQIFKGRSSTFYVAARFFPNSLKEDVAKLYSFVRVADDWVDKAPPETKKLQQLYKAWSTASPKSIKDSVSKEVLQNMLDIEKKYSFDPSWLVAFFDSMFLDISHNGYKTLADSLKYVHGSGEVIGLMMARMMGCEPSAYKYAQLQGRAWQWLNFVRDIKYDVELGRNYFPKDDLARFGLIDLTGETAKNNPAGFADYVHFQLQRYKHWQKEAERGYKFIPPLALAAIKSANKEYEKIADSISKDPPSVFKTKTQLPKQ